LCAYFVRRDWKYLLGLELTAAGFHYSVLSEFRQRLLEHSREGILLEQIIARCEEKWQWLATEGFSQAKERPAFNGCTTTSF
jgi:transposase